MPTCLLTLRWFAFESCRILDGRPVKVKCDGYWEKAIDTDQYDDTYPVKEYSIDAAWFTLRADKASELIRKRLNRPLMPDYHGGACRCDYCASLFIPAAVGVLNCPQCGARA